MDGEQKKKLSQICYNRTNEAVEVVEDEVLALLTKILAASSGAVEDKQSQQFASKEKGGVDENLAGIEGTLPAEEASGAEVGATGGGQQNPGDTMEQQAPGDVASSNDPPASTTFGSTSEDQE